VILTHSGTDFRRGTDLEKYIRIGCLHIRWITYTEVEQELSADLFPCFDQKISRGAN
jgi:hypothetical protein